MSPFDRAVAGCRHALHALQTLGDQLTDEHWVAATGCPEWNVGDIYAHVIHIEWWMAAGGAALPGEIQDRIDHGVVKRRGLPRAEVLAELRQVVARREVQLTTELREADSPGYWVWSRSEVPFEFQLSGRAFDLWVHEQDVRRAIGRPGNLGSAGAQVSRDMIMQTLPGVVAKGAGAPAGSTVRFTTLGALPMDFAVHVDEPGRAAIGPADAHRPTTHLTMDWESFVLLSTGRVERADRQIWLTGDTTLAEQVLAALNVAP